MARVRIDSENIVDWASFHEVGKEVFGFPSFYGMNLNAFIDCLTYIDEGDGMSNIVLGPGELLRIEVTSADDLRTRQPGIYQGFVDAVGAVNRRFIEGGKAEKIEIVAL